MKIYVNVYDPAELSEGQPTITAHTYEDDALQALIKCDGCGMYSARCGYLYTACVDTETFEITKEDMTQEADREADRLSDEAVQEASRQMREESSYMSDKF